MTQAQRKTFPGLITYLCQEDEGLAGGYVPTEETWPTTFNGRCGECWQLAATEWIDLLSGLVLPYSTGCQVRLCLDCWQKRWQAQVLHVVRLRIPV